MLVVDAMLSALIIILCIIVIGLCISWLVPMPDAAVRKIFWLVIVILCLIVLIGALQGHVYFRML